MSGTIVIGRRSIRYTDVAEKDTNADGKMDRVSYYDGDQLLATAYDDDGDGEHDMWVTFDADLRVDQEVVDRDHDGSADVMRSLDAAGKVVSEGQAPSVEAKPDPEPEPEPAKPVVVATQPTEPALPDGFPLDHRLGIGAGILVLTILLTPGPSAPELILPYHCPRWRADEHSESQASSSRLASATSWRGR